LGGGRLRPDILDGLAYADLTAGGERNLIVLNAGDVLGVPHGTSGTNSP
jgi:hypothetical protein